MRKRETCTRCRVGLIDLRIECVRWTILPLRRALIRLDLQIEPNNVGTYLHFSVEAAQVVMAAVCDHVELHVLLLTGARLTCRAQALRITGC
jgi:hypothetical protein